MGEDITAINFESFDWSSLLSEDVNEAWTVVQLMMNNIVIMAIMDELNCPRERICHG